MDMTAEFPWRIFAAFGGFAICFLLAFVFFASSDDVPLKRKLLPPVAAFLGVLFLAVPWAAGFPPKDFIAFVPMVVVAVILGARSIRFCDSCGITIRDNGLWRRAFFCSKCGSTLKR